MEKPGTWHATQDQAVLVEMGKPGTWHATQDQAMLVQKGKITLLRIKHGTGSCIKGDVTIHSYLPLQQWVSTITSAPPPPRRSCRMLKVAGLIDFHPP
eukprot:1142097-Pelagomonas_calceolata.AAC.4